MTAIVYHPVDKTPSSRQNPAMSTSYHAGLAIGVELTDEMLFGAQLRTVNGGCSHNIVGRDTRFCPQCGKKVELKKVYKLKPPFNEGEDTWSQSANSFWARNNTRSFDELTVVRVGYHSWDNPDHRYILGEQLVELNLSDGQRLESMAIQNLVGRQAVLEHRLRAAGVGGDLEVRLWSYGYGC